MVGQLPLNVYVKIIWYVGYFRKTHWIDTKPLAIEIPLSLNLTYRDYRLNNVQRLSFSVVGMYFVSTNVLYVKYVLTDNIKLVMNDHD